MRISAIRSSASKLAPAFVSVSLYAGALLACGDANEPSPARDAHADAASHTSDDDAGSTPGDASLATKPQDASSQASDAQRAAADGGSDATTEVRADASSAQPGSDAGFGASSRRSEICGTATSFPNPLPSETSKRRAQAVGTLSFGFLEGPVWIASQGVLLFSDMDFSGGDAMGPPARIRRLTPPATFDEFSPSSNSNGLALALDGSLLAATHDNQALSRFSLANAARTPLKVRADGKRFNSPNDLVVRSDGTVYFTDPDWQLGPRDNETKITGVYRVPAPLNNSGDNAAALVDGTLTKPNGIALSPDEQTLYVGSQGNEIWKYPVRSDGSVGARSKFADTGSSDGMAIDCAGNLYVTSGTVEVFAPSGTKLGDISLDGSPSNAAFGGPDRKTLYITAGPKLYAIELAVAGFPY